MSNHAAYQVRPGDQEFLFISFPTQEEILVVQNWFEELKEGMGGN